MLLLGSGELGKEVAIELQRLGAEVVAVDSYANAPAKQVAHRFHVVDMLDPVELRAVIELERPHVIVPEVEAIATAVLADVEAGGVRVVPTARATQLTMNREGIRRLAAEELGLATSPFRFVDTAEELAAATAGLGFPCALKPVMSSSGKGQSVLHGPEELASAWRYAQEGGRAGGGRCIVEGFVEFDSEITLLTVRHAGGTSFLDPVGHIQVDGDYRESWQPAGLSAAALAAAQAVAAKVTDALGGWGLFGVHARYSGFPPEGRSGWAERTSRRPPRARCWLMASASRGSAASMQRLPSRQRRCGCSASRRWPAIDASPSPLPGVQTSRRPASGHPTRPRPSRSRWIDPHRQGWLSRLRVSLEVERNEEDDDVGQRQ